MTTENDEEEIDEEEDRDEFGDEMRGGDIKTSKFKFKIGGNAAANGQQNGQFPITSSTSYGTKFIDLRKTFQNFNANSNKILQTTTAI